MLYTHMQIHAYTCRIIHNDTRKKDERRLLLKNIPLNLFASFERVVWGSTVRRSWRPNKTAIYWPPLLWPSALCLSRSPWLLNRRPRGPAHCWMMAFFTASYQQLLLTPTHSGAPRAPSAWCGCPYHILPLTPSLSNFSGAPRASSAGLSLPDLDF